MKSVAVSHVVYLIETQFRSTLRTATRLQHFVARQRNRKGAEKLENKSNNSSCCIDCVYSCYCSRRDFY
ncbi:hypothetical protein [Pilibacter termitis]|uniref:hypothetical protein n=1 Tax=Pilibacter termitis TaxID=263852 RepID=UPI001186F524|nr:hypothetical protein [Pilibacter termitis]